LVSFLQFLLFDRESKSIQKQLFYNNDTYENMQVEIALAYTEEIESMEISFANNIKTPEGGMHLTGFRTALTRVLNDYIKNHNKDGKDAGTLTGDDVREGLVALISVKLHEPQFEGQTKAKLGNPEARIAVDQIMSKSFRDFLEKNPDDAKRIIEKCMISARARNAAKAARDNVLRKSVFETATLPGKLADCISNKPSESELFIVEGESAGGCFSGDTKVALTDGRNLSFLDLIKEQEQGKQNYCYTIQENGSIGIAPIVNARKTKSNAKVVKLTLDNEEEILCTPDHRFMIRNGEYKEVQLLTKEDSLMPLYKKYSKIEKRITIEGYEMVQDPGTYN
jgi:DNA gyrase subunit B